jgi:hypothetical protein
VRKLAQKFELDHSKPAQEQIRKTVFKYIDEHDKNSGSQGSTIVYYHVKNGQIYRPPVEYLNKDILTLGAHDGNNKDG